MFSTSIKKLSVVANLLSKMTRENIPFVNDVRHGFSDDLKIVRGKDDIAISRTFIMKQ